MAPREWRKVRAMGRSAKSGAARRSRRCALCVTSYRTGAGEMKQVVSARLFSHCHPHLRGTDSTQALRPEFTAAKRQQIASSLRYRGRP